MYRLGFLLCDHPMDHLAERFGDYESMFARAFAEVADGFEWVVFDVTAGQLPPHATACDGYLISGSRHGAYDPLPWIPPLTEFIQQVNATSTPMVGLCFGHQIIGHALGGAVNKSDKGWGIGVCDYVVDIAEPWMTPPREQFSIPACHQDQILSLPPGAIRLAGNEHCENFVVRFADNMVGIQGHPEFAVDFLEALIKWRESSLSPSTLESARNSLNKTHDNRLVKSWIVQFLGLQPGDSTT